MRLIVATNSSNITDRERDLITGFLEGKGWSVWHWFSDIWLVDQAPEDVSFTDLRDQIQALFPQKRHLLILTTEGRKDHSAWLPNAAFPWMIEHWETTRTS